MSRVYPERKWTNERRHHTEKRNLNRLKQISRLTLNITKGKPDIRGSGEKENARNARFTKQTEDFPASNNVK
jgi:hypothetical protein